MCKTHYKQKVVRMERKCFKFILCALCFYESAFLGFSKATFYPKFLILYIMFANIYQTRIANSILLLYCKSIF
jgi:hypothetical protein